MRRLVLLAGAVSLVAVGLTSAGPAAAGPAPAMITFVQAVPGVTVDVAVDGRAVATNAQVGDVLGPFEVAPGERTISFSGDGLAVDSTLEVTSGATSDVVLHLPAAVGGEPLVTSFQAPAGAIGPGKARVMLAHTATVAPADVEVNGQTVFTNIANGEYADADVPEGTISVALLPSGSTGDPILGPLDVSLEAGTLSMIYAYGNPRDGSMNVISHTTRLASDGSVRPTLIDAGSAGLVDGPVRTFGPGRVAGGASGAAAGAGWAAAAVALIGALLLAPVRARSRRIRPAPSRR